MNPIQEKLIVLETLLKQLTSMKASPDIISAVLSEIDRLKNGGNLWSLLCSTGVLFLPPGGCQFAHSTLPVDNRLKHVILFRTVCYTDTNTYSHEHLLRNQFNNLHNTSTKPDQAVVIIGATRQTSSNVLLVESCSTSSIASSNETRWVLLLHWASSIDHGQTS